MNRYWVSWWSEFEYPKDFPIEVWISGERYKNGLEENDTEFSYCAAIEFESEEKIWENVRKFFPDCEQRFCELRELTWTPWTPSKGGRFIGDYDRMRF